MNTVNTGQERSGRQASLFGFLTNISTGWKMTLIVSVLFLGILGITLSGYAGLQSLRYQLSNIYDFMLVPIVAINQADTALAGVQYDIAQSYSEDLSLEERTQLLAGIAPGNKIAQDVITRYDTEWVTTASPEFTQALRDGGKLALQEQELSALADYHSAYDAYLASLEEYLAIVDSGNPDPALANQAVESLLTARANLQELIVINNQYADFSNELAQNAYNQSLTNGGIVLATVAIIGLILSYLIAVSITSRLGDLTRSAASIQGGNLDQTVVVAGRDELGLLGTTFNNMARQLKDLFGSLEQKVANRTHALEVSGEVSRRLSTILNQKELVSEVVNQVNNAFAYHHTQIYFYDEANENLVMAGGTGTAGEKMLAQSHKVAKGRGLVGRAAESNEAVLVSDTSQNPDWLPNPLLPETKSEVAVPISLGDQVLGVLDAQHNLAGGLQQEDVNSLQPIANQIAVALQNIRQYENTQKIAADMGVVASVGIAASSITESGDLLQEVVELAKKSFKLYHAHIYLLNEAGDTLELASGAGEAGRQMVSEKRSIPLNSEQSLVARAARSRVGVTVNDVTAAADFLPNPLLPDTRAELAAPMIVAGKVIGVLDVQSEIVNRFTDVDVSIQTTLASQVAVALQNARSFSQAQRLAQRETAVNLITQKIQGATSIEAALQVTARELGRALGMKQTLVTIEPDGTNGEHKSDS